MANKSRNPAIIFIFFTILVDVIGFGIIIPVFPKLLETLIDGDLSEASQYSGWLMFVFAIMQFICSPIFGGLSDRYGRRPILLISLFGFGIDYILMGLAPTIGWLFVGRVIAGITGASFTTASAYIADISKPEERAANFGMIGAAFGLGFIIGPVMGGLLGVYGPSVPFFAAAGLSLLNWLYGYFILPESLSPENRRAFDWKRANPVGSLIQIRRYPIIVSLIASLLCIYVAGHANQSTWSFITIEKFQWSEDLVGYSLGFVGLMFVIVQGWLIRIIVPRLGQRRSVFIGFMLNTLGYLGYAFATESWMMFALIVPFALGGIAGPTLQAIISSQVPADEQGEVQGALASLLSITTIIGPLMMTYLFSFYTSPQTSLYFPGMPFFAAAVLSFIGVLLAIPTLRKIKD